MSKIQETAPDTIYLNIGSDTDDDLDFDLDAEVTWCHEPVFDNDIKYIKQSKLSIPKWLVDKLSTVYEFEEGYDFNGFILDHVALDNIEEKKLSEYAVEHGLVVYAYLNPLTRDFVEVVE